MFRTVKIFHPILLLALVLVGSGTARAESRCSEHPATALLPARINCSHQTAWVASGPLSVRQVIYQTPLGTAPPTGWPLVLVYQGSFFPLDDFSYHSLLPFGGFHEGQLVQTLLDSGYAVIAPSAPADLFWQTNIPGPAQLYELSSDYLFIGNVLEAIRQGFFGDLDPSRQYATGISSGGYNTSRMAVSFPGRFKALAIQSGSYATCSGPLCAVPELPADHPPTAFLHGQSDIVVPSWTMDRYYQRLLDQGIETTRYVEPNGHHAWFATSPQRIRAWFDAHP